jgi:putative tricarboxylic transport membrane protein
MFRIPPIVAETIFLLAMGLAGIVQAVVLIINPDPYATYDKIGPGGFLILISALLIITVMVNFIRHRKDFNGEKRESTKEGMTRRLVRSYAAMVIFIALIDIIGFLPASLILFFFMLRLLGVRSWLRSALLSIVFSISIYLLFVQALKVDLPGGLLLEFIRGE